MMTTDRPARSADRRAVPPSGARLLVRSAASTAVLGLLGAAVAALVDGGAAASGVLVGVGLVLVVLVGGSLMVDAVAGVLPVASLMVALLTFTLQVVLVLLLLAALDSSGLLEDVLDRGWLGGGVIGATMLWLAVQVRLHTTTRLPVYDLADAGPGRLDEGGH